MAALSGILANPDVDAMTSSYDLKAEQAYVLACAMMHARDVYLKGAK